MIVGTMAVILVKRSFSTGINKKGSSQDNKWKETNRQVLSICLFKQKCLKQLLSLIVVDAQQLSIFLPLALSRPAFLKGNRFAPYFDYYF